MKFEYLGSTFEIEFERQRRKSQLKEGDIPSRLTTVKIYKTTPGKLPGELVRSATSACSRLDNFNKEAGRLAALKALTSTMSNDRPFKEAIWQAYINRPRAKRHDARTVPVK